MSSNTHPNQKRLVKSQIAEILRLALENPSLHFTCSYLGKDHARLFQCTAGTESSQEITVFIHLEDKEALDKLLNFEDVLIEMIAE